MNVGIRDKIFKKSNEIDEDEYVENDSLAMGHDVFISYSTKDAPDANEVCDVLEENNIKCWIAPRDIVFPNKFGEQIINAIRKSKAVVLILSRYSNESKYVLKEIKEAFNRNIPIILFNIDACVPDGAMNFYTKNSPHLNSYVEKNYNLLVKKAFNTCYGQDYPFPPYDGEDKYIFVSFALEDAEKVFPDIREFQDLGYNVWYDELLNEEENGKTRSQRLEESDLCIVFVTNESMESENVYNDLYNAITIFSKNIIPIYLEDFDNIKFDEELEFQLSRIQGITKTTLHKEEYVSKFTEAFEKFGFEIPKK